MRFDTRTPRKSISTGGVVVFALILVATFFGRLAWDLSDPRPAEAQTGCRQVETITGNGIKQTAPFTITSQTWRLDYGFTATTKMKGVSSLDIEVYNAKNRMPVDTISLENPGSDSSFENTGPGSYYLSIGSANARWKVTVLDCGAAAPPPSSSSASSTPQSSPVSSSPPAPMTTAPSGTRLGSGGPKTGPVPLMPSGRCPKEFPIERAGACYDR